MKNQSKKSASRKSASANNRTRLNGGLFIVRLKDENPRRKGSLGYKSYDVVVKARKPIQVATFVEKGGRLRDLHWDLTHGNLKLVNKKVA